MISKCRKSKTLNIYNTKYRCQFKDNFLYSVAVSRKPDEVFCTIIRYLKTYESVFTQVSRMKQDRQQQIIVENSACFVITAKKYITFARLQRTMFQNPERLRAMFIHKSFTGKTIPRNILPI